MEDASRLKVTETPTGIKLSSSHGSLCLSSDGDRLFVHDLVGDGKDGAVLFVLWSEAQEIARALGYAELFAHVEPGQERLFKLYTKKGGMSLASVVLKKDLTGKAQK